MRLSRVKNRAGIQSNLAVFRKTHPGFRYKPEMPRFRFIGIMGRNQLSYLIIRINKCKKSKLPDTPVKKRRWDDESRVWIS